MGSDDTPSQHDHESLFRRSPAMLCVLSLDGRVLKANVALAEALGLSADALLGASLADRAHEDDRTALRAALRELERAVPVRGLELRVRCEDGQFRALSWDFVPDPDMRQAHGCARDLGQEGATLRRFKALLDITSDYVAIVNMKGERIYTNPAARRLIGREGEDVRPVTALDVMPPDVQQKFKEEIIPTLLREGRWNGESAFAHVSGERIPALQSGVLLRDADGKPEAMAVIARDIRDQKRREAELRRFKTLLDTAPDFIAMSTLDGRITYVNPAGMELTGRAGQDPTSLTIADFATKEALERLPAKVMPALLRDGTFTDEGELVRPNGTRVPVSQAAVLLRDEHGQPEALGAIARDLTPQRQLEAALRHSLHEMATPIIQVWDGVLALPVIGLVDSQRATQMMDALLLAISETQCDVAVLDLTGVGTIDTSTVNHLFKMVTAASLLGTLCVVSGITSNVARIMSGLGLDVSEVQTFRSLREALRFAVRHAAGRHQRGSRLGLQRSG